MSMRSKFALAIVLAVLAVAVMAQTPRKPVWPRQFSSPFGFNMALPKTVNASAMLYYNWEVKSQMVHYTEHCVPFVSARSYFYPCKLFFDPSGIHVVQPEAGNDCCMLVPGVGSIPPRFLDPFNFTNVEKASDMYGNVHTCNHWSGIDGFAYWTDDQTGHDVQFKDGDTGVFWNFGDFNVVPQSPSLFQLPSNNCNKPCSVLSPLSSSVLTSLYRQFYARSPIH